MFFLSSALATAFFSVCCYFYSSPNALFTLSAAGSCIDLLFILSFNLLTTFADCFFLTTFFFDTIALPTLTLTCLPLKLPATASSPLGGFRGAAIPATALIRFEGG